MLKWSFPELLACIDLCLFFQVNSIYVKNLPNNVTEDHLRRPFEHHGKINIVDLPTPKCEYGFVHFSERSAAKKALRNSERHHLDGKKYFIHKYSIYSSGIGCGSPFYATLLV